MERTGLKSLRMTLIHNSDEQMLMIVDKVGRLCTKKKTAK